MNILQIVDMVKESGGYLAVPWFLVRNWPEFFEKTREEGVPVSVFGFEEFDNYRLETNRAIALGANIIIGDYKRFG